MKTNPKDYNPEYLRNTRLKRGLTEKELAERVGVNVSTIAGYESGNFRPSVRRWKMLKDALEIADTWTEPDEREPEPVKFMFEAGRSYTIKDTGWRNKECDLISPNSGWNCVFLYMGKSGVHHVFREARGGWQRTYTDAQLIGKRIEEV